MKRIMMALMVVIMILSVPMAGFTGDTKISVLNEREVSLKKITVKGKTIKIGYSSDRVLKIIPESSFMEQTVTGNSADNSMTVTKSYYYGDRYFKLVFMRINDSGYAVVDILEKRFK